MEIGGIPTPQKNITSIRLIHEKKLPKERNNTIDFG